MSTFVTPMRDHERVLGQITRGEIQAGPDAARRIAARHQTAYGTAFDGPPAEVLRRQMHTATTTRTEGDDAV
jgi:hypothetical protein